MNNENYEKAIELYSKAIELDDKNAIYFNNRSFAYFKALIKLVHSS